jgi:hypothetical protein
MKGISRIGRVLQISMAVCLLHAQAFADTPAPLRDFKKVAGAYVFVMLAPDEPSGAVQHVSEIREVYKRSGLYRYDGSSTPLWTVDWYAYEVFPSSDGEHLVRIWSMSVSVDDSAVSFYKNGKEVKNYRIKDLIRNVSQLRRSASFLHWKADVDYNDKIAVLLLRTSDFRTHRFSVKTGEILR